MGDLLEGVLRAGGCNSSYCHKQPTEEATQRYVDAESAIGTLIAGGVTPANTIAVSDEPWEALETPDARSVGKVKASAVDGPPDASLGASTKQDVVEHCTDDERVTSLFGALVGIDEEGRRENARRTYDLYKGRKRHLYSNHG